MTSPSRLPVVLASASPGRLALLRAAGIDPIVQVSGVDEDGVTAANIDDLVLELARRKAEAVAAQWGTEREALLIAGDSLLDVDARPVGKPGSDEACRAIWREIRGRSADLVTGHHVMLFSAGLCQRISRVVRTTVRFAPINDQDIEAYVATGEPHQVAGAFTLDGYGAAFVEGIDGDPHNVLGLSIPALRTMVADLGVTWTDLWGRPTDS